MKTALLLLGPLVVLIGVALALFGTSGPADNDVRAQAMFRLIGMVYGIYLIALSLVWARRNARKERR
jgi:uncharacterized membrane protein